jgi:hypothetical protein
LAVDSAGTVYFSDRNQEIEVTSKDWYGPFAGEPYTWGAIGGATVVEDFSLTGAIAFDRADNIYVSGPMGIGRITPGGFVTPLAIFDSTDGTSHAIPFWTPAGIAVDRSGNLYVAASGMILKGVQIICAPPSNTNRLLNISTRSLVGNEANVQIAGFVIAGSAPKQVLLRASGPALATAFGLTGALEDPVIELHNQSTGATIAINDDWDPVLTSSFAAVGAFPWTTGSKDAALVTTLEPGAYTVVVKGKNNGTGVALVEVYDADSGTPGSNLINISTRAQVGTDANVLIAGFVVGGNTPKKVVVRAAGPALGPLGVSGVLADPILELHDQGTNAVLATNDDWDSALAADFAKVGAFAWTAGSKDAALVATLNPGLYTVVVKGRSNGTGVALVEVYEEP